MKEKKCVRFTIAAVYLWRKRKLVQELRLDEVRFQQYFRLGTTPFDELLLKEGKLVQTFDWYYSYMFETLSFRI